MPSGKNWANFLYVNIAFGIYILLVFYYSQIAIIKANWPLYRCNPMYMFLADNVEENFTYCVQGMQSNFMGYLLQPITFITGSLGQMMGGFTEDLQNIRAMFSKIRTFFSSIIQSVFGVFLNLIIEFLKIIIGIRDLFGKTIGIMTTLMYTLDGSVITMQSAWNGPPGQLVKAMGSVSCFFPDTKIKLKNGIITSIKDIPLGSILENDSRVLAVMKLENAGEQLYKINILNSSNI